MRSGAMKRRERGWNGSRTIWPFSQATKSQWKRSKRGTCGSAGGRICAGKQTSPTALTVLFGRCGRQRPIVGFQSIHMKERPLQFRRIPLTAQRHHRNERYHGPVKDRQRRFQRGPGIHVNRVTDHLPTAGLIRGLRVIRFAHDGADPEHRQQIGLRASGQMYALALQLRQKETSVDQPRGQCGRHRYRHHHGKPRLPVARQFKHNQRGGNRRAQHRRCDRPHARQCIKRSRAGHIREQARGDQPKAKPRQRTDHQRRRKHPAPHAPRHCHSNSSHFEHGKDNHIVQRQLTGQRQRRRLVPHADDMGIENRHPPQNRARHSRPQPARQPCARLQGTAHIIRPENRPHQHHSDKAGHQTQQQKGR
mmetsp:Transcript_18272/g.29014  ORF Transcript_18272/g.29014 Transcript_18272/m.29014 type:complete len:364 (+) Transcript_18272:5281-6372(+)